LVSDPDQEYIYFKKLCGRSKVAKSPCAREGGASIGDRLALDESAIDGLTQNGNIGKR